MFERFTDRARSVVVLAQEEARMLDHSHIGTEHLLLGLIRGGVAGRAVESLGISLEAVRRQVGEIVGRGQQAPPGHIPRRVIGQNVAIKALSQAIRRTRAGLKDPKRPGGSFIFAGPSGVGKTELSRTLAEFLFGDEDAPIQLDMSEYMEKHTVSRLFGSPPGYVGYEEGGQLTEKVRRKPFSVVLFDEIEKAHPDIFNSLLQILEDGRLTDAQGRVVDFKNTVIIMTTNLGTRDISKGVPVGFGTAGESRGSYDRMKTTVQQELKQHFRPEFLNRVDDTIVFHQLSQGGDSHHRGPDDRQGR